MSVAEPEEWRPETTLARPLNVVSPKHSRTYYGAEFPHGIVITIIVDSSGYLEPGAMFFEDRDALLDHAGDGYRLTEPGDA